jgi:stress-induced-phosphoprotein 1
MEKANEFKTLGNEAFKNKQYEEAIKYFTQAIECNPNDHTFFSNRSGSYANSGKYEKALEDANTCITYSQWDSG